MKYIKRLLMLIVMLLILASAGILVCALNPSLTQKLADKIQLMKQPVETPSDLETEGLVQELATKGYLIPESLPQRVPEQVTGLTGYQPLIGQTEQILQEEADNLSSILSPGETGENAEFSQLYYPYYSMLNPTLQQLYRQVYANAEKLITSFAPVVPVTTGQVKNVMEAVYNDHPELFWLESEYSCKYLKTGICVEITLRYNATANDLTEAKKQFQAYAEEILEGARKLNSIYEKEQYVHDALVQVAEYAESSLMNQSAYSALVLGRTVCAGYARAFQYLMQQLEIPCYYCAGYTGQEHAWNIVKLDDGYRNVDVTWDDTDPGTYDYYNKTDSEFMETHVRTGLSIYLPACEGALHQGSSVATEGIADAYINPNPQKPLRWQEREEQPEEPEKSEEEKKKENLEKAGITEDEVMETLKEYYEDCKASLIKVGVGDKKFSNVVPESLWPSIERAYGEGGHRAGYVDDALKELKVENFVIQIQVQRLGGGYCRIYHNIYTY
ncbi:MAG: transglutaminase domain-containing protein [Acetatifactor sp.]